MTLIDRMANVIDYNREIEDILRRWFTGFVRKYKKYSPQFKFEFNNKRGIYLISYNIQVDIISQDYTYLVMDIFSFSDMLSIMYGNQAPLFTENNELFTVSEKAIIIK